MPLVFRNTLDVQSRWVHADALGVVTFTASTDHATVMSYEIRVRQSGNSTVVGSENIGKPTPNADNDIFVDMSPLFAELDAGTYTVSVAAADVTGIADSVESDAFTLPLA